MQMIPRWLWPIALSILWTNFAIPPAANLCERVNVKGEIQFKNSDLKHVEEICDCENLKSLSFKKCEFVELPVCLSLTSQLKTISFTKTNIQRLPNEIFEFQELQNLDLSFTNIVFLPENLYELSALKTLNLRGTEIASLPEGLEFLESIDMRMIDLNRSDQETIFAQYPEVKIFFSSPCQCK